MSWRDQLRDASFRGVPFFVQGHESEAGRRLALHEYPLRDKPFAEDLGRRARRISIEAFVLSTADNAEDYMPGRDALLAALDQEGPGTLVHPYLGELRVACETAKLKETIGEGGVARFTISFVEAGQETFPVAGADTQAQVNDQADAAEDAAVADFGSTFTVAGSPSFVADAASARMLGFTSTLNNLRSLVPIDPTALASFSPEIASLQGQISALILVPTSLARSVIQKVAALRSLPRDPLSLLGEAVGIDPNNDLKLLRKLFDFGKPGSSTPPSNIPTSTPARVQQASNEQAVSSLVQRAAVITAVRAASDKDFGTFQDAQAVRDELADQLTTVMESSDDDVYAALAALRAASIRDLDARAGALGRLVGYMPAETRPALAIAYELYEDATRDLEIVARNNIPHPGFVPGGRQIQVLDDAA